MIAASTTKLPLSLLRYRSPKTVIGRFVARRTVRGALLWAVVFGIYVASKAIGFVDLYPTALARQKIAETFGSNVGIQLLIGQAPHSATTAAYVAWNTAGITVVIGSIWALLLATKYLRGEEDVGRSEVLLAGQTTAVRATINTLLGLMFSLAVFFVVIFGLFTAVGRSHGVDFGSGASLFYAFAVTLGISLFMMVGALTSQLMPTRSQAAGVSGVILGIFFLMRAIGDVTSAHWMLNFTPLGWLEKLQPLARVQALWLIPFLVVLAVSVCLTIYFAAKRDLGESIISDKTDQKSHFRLLGSPFGLTLRLTRGNSFGWLSAVFVIGLIYGLIAKSTGQIFSQSKSFEKVINHLARSARLSSLLAFLGIVFFMQMILVMVYAANSVSSIRREEAAGYVDNFLVQPFSRLRWLAGRLANTAMVITLAGLLTTISVYLGIFSEHTGISISTIFLASINAIIPAVLLLAVGLIAYGVYPRLTSLAAYGVLAWSALIELVSSGLNINHWLLDTSILHQVVLAPSVSPKWSLNLIILAIALVLILIGALGFNHRDLEGE